ncbi:MAG: UDP-N-acetylglucosamine 2-epimerase (non-hydrolyzing) [Rhodanobacteraceae bacterium]|nr:UDP-N-acetylglucosamine 2-epimerase (non-hydrolyzing) [Rhodanobacteraceae bacterium]
MVAAPLKVLCVVSARPNFMKIAPIMRAFQKHPDRFCPLLVHTGQHYDVAMNERFFQQLRIPNPDISLEVGSGTHAAQTADVMKRFEPVLDQHQPDVVLVVGDVNSTIACALVAAKKGIKVVHVEAGLRSRDRTMPEEINRLLTDQLSDRLYVTEAEAIDNLLAEGIARDKIAFVGNVMIDTLLASLPEAVPAAHSLAGAFDGPLGPARRAAFAAAGRHGVLTLHRPSNVDDRDTLERLLQTVAHISDQLPIAFPVHPRTRAKITQFGLDAMIELPGLAVLPPLGYLEMLGLMREATLVFTDSGGVQEETTALGVPCLTLRENTERPITVTEGTNRVVGTAASEILSATHAILDGASPAGRRPSLWDGNAAARIAQDLSDWNAQTADRISL